MPARSSTFTFPHIGNVGANDEDVETVDYARVQGARGLVVQAPVTEPSNFRAEKTFDAWLKARGIIGLAGVDTRALTVLIREKGMPNAVIAYDPDGKFDLDALKAEAAAWPGIDGMDLVPGVTAAKDYGWTETTWKLGSGYGAQNGTRFKVVALDFGVKRNILRLLAEAGCDVKVVPATTSPEDILALKPDGIFLSNGPGDPAETGKYAVPTIRKILEAQGPDFRDLPGPPDDGARGRRQDDENAPGPSRRQSSGQGFHDPQGRDRLDEPWLRGRSRDFAGERRRDPQVAVRRHQLRHRARPIARPSRCSTTRKPRRARRTAITCSRGSSR